ncbi:MAG: PRC-barrel domain protein [Pelotomaculum sp. PtaB.Bin104]|nr:MAG: PRC-barrel domain protein [Pelotomaculum sp. PtaB.Bin104]
MKKSKQLLSLAVISLEEGQQIGNVKGLVIDPAGKKLAALIIEQKGWFKEQRFIPYHKVHSIGSDAVTIEKSSCVEKGGALSEIVKLLKDRVSISGSKLVAENGTVLGYVDEYYIDLTTGAITGLEFSGNLIDSVIKGRAFLDAAYVRTLGKEVAIVTNEGIENIFRLDGGLQETVKNIKESTGQIWENTFKKTKELSTSINKKVKREKSIIAGSDSALIDKPASPPATSDINDVDQISRPEDRSEK